MPLAWLTLRRRPAVSTSCHVSPSISTSESTGSVVVPAPASTTARVSPVSWLSRLDLPTLGFPTSATRRGPPSRSTSSRGDSGITSSTASSRSPEPRPCSPDTGYGSPSPRRHSAGISVIPRSSSTFVAHSSTGSLLRRSVRATASSTVVAPTWPSTTSRIASAVRIAVSAWAEIAACMPLASGTQPPVSRSVNRLPFHSAS